MPDHRPMGPRPHHVVDGAVPLVTAENLVEHLPDIRAGGLTALAPTVASLESYDVAMTAVRRWHRLAGAVDAPVAVCTRPGDLRAARAAGRLGVVLHFQGGDPLEGSLDRLRDVAAAGVRVVQPTYNGENALGAGSMTKDGRGLTAFGRAAVAAMAELGVLPDVSHANERTALDTLEAAAGPVIASHSNAKTVYDHPRNVSDDVIRGIAARGGVVGVCGFPGFLGPQDHAPTADDVLDHAIHVAELVGEEHVSIGLDLADEDEDDYVYFGYDPAYYPPPPWTYPPGIAGFTDFPAFAARARARGLGDAFVTGLMGDNYVRVLSTVA